MTWPFIKAPQLPEPEDAETLAYYRNVLEQHADDAVTGLCRVCCRHRCPDWCNAFLRLIDAGQNPDGLTP